MKKKIGKSMLAAAVCAALFSEAAAFAAVPDSGSVAEGIRTLPVLQSERKGSVSVNSENLTGVSDELAQQQLEVNKWNFTGDSPVAAAELYTIVKDKQGTMSVAELHQIAAKVTSFLREKGYPLAYAYVPAQKIQKGVVNIEIFPGKYGTLKVEGDAANMKYVQGLFSFAKKGGYIRSKELERAILLANDRQGLQISALLSPGQERGTADLKIKAISDKEVAGLVYVDNFGTRYTGRIRLGAQASLGNISGHLDQLEIGGLFTQHNSIKNYRVNYEVPLGSQGWAVGLRYSHLNYVIGEEFAALDFGGSVRSAGAYLSYPLKRGYTENMKATLAYDKKYMSDTQGVFEQQKRNHVWTLGISGNMRHAKDFSYTTWKLEQTFGKLQLEDEFMDVLGTNRNFNKTVVSASHRRSLSNQLSWFTQMSAQHASKNLDSSEKLYLGGANAVRAYAQGESGGDEGYLVSTELQYRLQNLPESLKEKGQLYVTTFFDMGHVKLNKNPIDTKGNGHTLKGAGIGLQWLGGNNYSMRMDYAWRIGKAPGNDNADRGRFWLQAIRYF